VFCPLFYTCFYVVGNWHKEAFQEFEEEYKLLEGVQGMRYKVN